MRRWLVPALLTAVVAGPLRAADKETVFDVQAILATPLNPRTLKTTEKEGIVTEEVRFHSERDGDKDVDIFALFSYPKGAGKLPAFVWNQGGLAQASPYWPEFGARRGYAVLCIDFPLPKYRSTGGYPINSGLELPDDARRAPIYHGAVALLKAVSYLESRSEVDRDRIGMAGSSWGGFFTTLQVGLDHRLKAGACMYGCGGLHLGNLWWDGAGRDPNRTDAFRERWRTTLDPAWRLAQTRAAIGWFTGTNDVFYWLPAVQDSYDRAAGPKHLSLLPNWNHAMTPALDEQVFAWLDTHLKGAPAFVKVGPIEVQKHDGTVARWQYQGPRQTTSAELILSYGDAGNWAGRYWKTLPADMKDGTCTVRLPASSLPYYVSGTVIDRDGFRSSTPVLRIDPAAHGLFDPQVGPEYDGCAEWGGFEPAQVAGYLKLHGHPVPPLSPEAKEGQQAAALKVGTTRLPPLLCTAGVPHRFTAFVKAGQPLDVTVQLLGPAGRGQPVTEQSVFRAGPDWTEVRLDFLPPANLTGICQAVVTVPSGGSVLLDAVRFRPVSVGRP